MAAEIYCKSMIATIYNTPVTVYRGVNYNPDGTPVPFRFETAFFNDDLWRGDYLFGVAENGELYPTGTVGNAVEVESTTEYKNYAEMMLSEYPDLPIIPRSSHNS